MSHPTRFLATAFAAGFCLFSVVAPDSSLSQPTAPTVARSPQEFLGYSLGERFTHYAQAEAYYRYLAQATHRMRILEYGQTYENRTLYLFVISSPENLARMDSIRENVAKLADPRTLSVPSEADALVKRTPVICWLSYNVHGNESSSAEAAIQVVYELVTRNDDEVKNILQDVIVLIDPLINPDGRERYVSYFEQTVGASPNADPRAAEHVESWPGGRFNHYLFDLNRDWAWQTQRETQARITQYRMWNPQIHVDYHEMGHESSYYFPPNAKPINTNVPAQVIKWLRIFGASNARAFDEKGWSYFTQEGFDLYYPAYGDSWPAFNGAIGMTYEQAGGGRGGLQIKRVDDTLLSLKDRIAHHVTTSFATLRTTAQNREALLRDFYQFKADALAEGERGEVKQYFFLPGNDPARTAAFVETLRQQGVEVHQAKKAFVANEAHDYFKNPPAKKEFPAGSYVVDLNQPNSRLAKALLEPEATLNDRFFYDVTAWSMPLAYGVDAFYSTKRVALESTPVAQPQWPKGGVIGEKARTAYAFRWNTNDAARLLNALLKEDFKASVALKQFKIQGEEFPAGTIVVPLERNDSKLHERITRLAEDFRVRVVALNTTLAESGIDLGSNRVHPLRKPKIAVVMNSPVIPSDYGALWFLFDHRYGISFTALKVDQLRTVDLKHYNVLIFPADFGTGRGYSNAIDRNSQDKIKRWVSEGGVFIGLKGGAVFATEKKSGLTSVTYRYLRKRDEEARLEEEKAAAQREGQKPEPEKPSSKDEKSQSEKEAKELEEKLRTWEQKEETQRIEGIPGTLMKIRLDNTHPLAFGYGTEAVVLNEDSPILNLTTKGDNVGYYPKEKFKVSGFLTPENEAKLPHTAYLIRESRGRGAVILFADTPNFRAFWEGTARLFLNSIFFGAISNPEFN